MGNYLPLSYAIPTDASLMRLNISFSGKCDFPIYKVLYI